MKSNKIIAKNFDKFFLTPYYETYGFKLQKGLFCRETITMYWTGAYLSYHLRYSPRFSIKIPIIIDIKKQIIKDEVSCASSTIIACQDKKLSQKMKKDINCNLSFYVFDESMYSEVFADHKLFMEHIGFPFFDVVLSMEQIDTFLNANAIEPNSMETIGQKYQWETTHQFFGSPCDALIAAKLAENPHLEILLDNYKKLYWQHERELHYISILEKDFLFK